MTKRILVSVAAASLSAFLAALATAQSGASGTDWPMYNHDLGGTRYSPLKQINTSNVGRLVRAWSYPVGKHASSGSVTGGSESVPIVVNGVLYVSASNHVAALEPETGKILWGYETAVGTPSRRGLAYWPGESGHEARVLFTSARKLVALSAATGKPVAEFGKDGEADMGQPYNSAPTVYKHLLIVGTNGAPGGLRAFDARTGAKVWEFFSVPKPGQPGFESWEGESWRNRSGVQSWGFSQTLDAARGIVYVTFEAPGPLDFYGGDRPGDGLFGNSLVALDAETGAYKWHFQSVHHDLWDYDSPAPPALVDVTVNGQRVPALALVGKTAYMYILDRVTGKPVFGVEERKVPGSNVPGEKPSPTQPFPLKPPPIARDSFKLDDLVTAADTTPEHAAYCRGLAEKLALHNEGPFTPYTYKSSGNKPRVTVLFPGSIGGPNWGGLAVDPETGYVFVNTSDVATTGWIEETKTGSAAPYSRETLMDGSTSKFQWNGRDPRHLGGELGWPCQRPPWGQLIAVNANTGDFAWKIPFGITEQLPPGKQNTGRMNMGGPIVTAGGLVFVGATNDHRFRAFDSKTGKELWTVTLPASAHSVPITYQGKDGRQYVAIVAAGDSALDDQPAAGSEALMTFALPAENRAQR